MAAANMTFRVDTDLRDEFFAVAQNQHVPASQVLRELMRGYVAKNKPVISDAERVARTEAVNGAVASTGLEGLTAGTNFRTATQRFISGEITIEELGAVALAGRTGNL